MMIWMRLYLNFLEEIIFLCLFLSFANLFLKAKFI